MDGVTTIRDARFHNSSIRVGGVLFRNCTFVDCQLLYDGQEEVGFEDCTFDKCEWTFDGPAENTLSFLGAIYNGLGEEGQQLVESVFQSIRANSVKNQTIPLIPRNQLKPLSVGR
jgi:hypothetical protein